MGDRITAAASAMNTLFGGRFTSWLNTELRIKRGLTYGASSSARSWAAGGLFTVGSYTKNDKIGEMLDIVFDLLRKGGREGFSAEETESGRNYILGQFPPTLETNASKAAAYVRLAFYKRGFDEYDRYLDEIGRLDPAALKAAAAALLPRTTSCSSSSARRRRSGRSSPNTAPGRRRGSPTPASSRQTGSEREVP